MEIPIVEERMKRQWSIRRELKPVSDGQRRWDQAYQYLLRWALLSESAQIPSSIQTQEVYDEHCDVCTRVDPAPGADPDHRTAARAVAGPGAEPGMGSAGREHFPG